MSDYWGLLAQHSTFMLEAQDDLPLFFKRQDWSGCLDSFENPDECGEEIWFQIQDSFFEL
jgi:hypothetical protein